MQSIGKLATDNAVCFVIWRRRAIEVLDLLYTRISWMVSFWIMTDITYIFPSTFRSVTVPSPSSETPVYSIAVDQRADSPNAGHFVVQVLRAMEQWHEASHGNN